MRCRSQKACESQPLLAVAHFADNRLTVVVTAAG
jgi:hypothetical protein